MQLSPMLGRSHSALIGMCWERCQTLLAQSITLYLETFTLNLPVPFSKENSPVLFFGELLIKLQLRMLPAIPLMPTQVKDTNTILNRPMSSL